MGVVAWLLSRETVGCGLVSQTLSRTLNTSHQTAHYQIDSVVVWSPSPGSEAGGNNNTRHQHCPSHWYIRPAGLTCLQCVLSCCVIHLGHQHQILSSQSAGAATVTKPGQAL